MSVYEGLQPEPFELRRKHRDDPRILRDVRAALAGVLGEAARNLVVLVDNGEVTLAGRVAERWMQLEIEHAALHVEGVRDVVSRVSATKTSAK
jgi:osmotically-inducible protein OsmY